MRTYDGRRQREVGVGDRLSGDKDVRYDLFTLYREERTGPAVAGRNLVRDEQDPVPVAQLPQCSQPPVGRNQYSARADYGLEKDGGHASRSFPLDDFCDGINEVFLPS